MNRFQYLLWCLFAVFFFSCEQPLEQEKNLLWQITTKNINQFDSTFQDGFKSIIYQEALTEIDSLMVASVMRGITDGDQGAALLQYLAVAAYNDYENRGMQSIEGDLSGWEGLINGIDRKWMTTYHLVGYYLNHHQLDKAEEALQKLLKKSNLLSDDRVKTLSLSRQAEYHMTSGNMEEAFRTFQMARLLAERLDDVHVRQRVYNGLSYFYHYNNVPKKANYWKKYELELIVNDIPMDSLAYYHSRLMQLDIQSKLSSKLDKERFLEILHFAKTNDLGHLMYYAEAFMKYYFIESGSGKALRQIYETYLPDEWNDIKVNDTITYHRIMGLCHLEDGEVNDAMKCYKQFSDYIQDQPSPAYRAKLYIEFAKIQLSIHQDDAAITLLNNAKTDAEASRYLPYEKEALNLLIEAYKNTGDYKSALEASEAYQQIDAQLLNLNQSEDLIALQITTENQIEQEVQRQEEASLKRKHNLQYMFILILILTLFIILMVLVKYRMPIWVIRSFGFIALIFAFEFTILLADHEIHHLTHGVPWKILSIKVILIAFMLPFHHWVEKKVLKYLLNKRKSKVPFLAIPWERIKQWFVELDKEETV